MPIRGGLDRRCDSLSVDYRRGAVVTHTQIRCQGRLAVIRWNVRVILSCLFGFLCQPAAWSQDPLDHAFSYRAKTDEAFQLALQEIATEFSESGHDDLARRSTQWLIPRTPGRQIVFAGVPRDDLARNPSADREDNPDSPQSRWQQAMKRARMDQADRLWDLVDQSLVEGKADRAMCLLREILWEHPQDKRALRALGVNRRGKSSQARIARNAQPSLGWPAGKYWRIQTEHFLITTNHSEDAANQLAKILEELHDVWEQLFVEFWTTAENIRQSVNGRGIRRRGGSKHKVVLFRNRDEYAHHLLRVEPQAKMTLGLYRANDRTSYFFAEDVDIRSDGQLSATWRHEVAHQLFFESTRRGHAIGEDDNFWLVEGLALYFESLQPHNGYYSIGGFESERLQFARFSCSSRRFLCSALGAFADGTCGNSTGCKDSTTVQSVRRTCAFPDGWISR